MDLKIRRPFLRAFLRAVQNRIVRDLFAPSEELDVQPEEFWSAVGYLTEAGRNGE